MLSSREHSRAVSLPEAARWAQCASDASQSQDSITTGSTAGGLTRKERQRMTETHKTRDLLATLRDALQQLACELSRTRDGVDAIATQVARIQESVAALGDLGQPEDTARDRDMLVAAATALLAAFRTLESGILDAQGAVDTLEAAMEDDEDGRDA
jgi:hypothetical protein